MNSPKNLSRGLGAACLILAAAFLGECYFSGCANLTPAQATTLADVENTAVNAGIGYLTGGQPGAVAAAAPSAVATLQEATYALRTTENPASAAVPSAGQINAIILAVAQNPRVSKAITPAVSKSIAAAVKSGAPPAKAVEAAATGLDTVATAYGTQVAARLPKMRGMELRPVVRYPRLWARALWHVPAREIVILSI